MIPTFQVKLRFQSLPSWKNPPFGVISLAHLIEAKFHLSGDTSDIPDDSDDPYSGCLDVCLGFLLFFLHFVPARLVRFFTSCATLGAYRRCEVPRQPCGNAPAITREESNPSVSWWFRFMIGWLVGWLVGWMFFFCLKIHEILDKQKSKRCLNRHLEFPRISIFRVFLSDMSRIYISLVFGRTKQRKPWLDVSENRGKPKSSLSIGFSIMNHPFWGFYPYFWKHLVTSTTKHRLVGYHHPSPVAVQVACFAGMVLAWQR